MEGKHCQYFNPSYKLNSEVIYVKAFTRCKGFVVTLM